MSLRPAIHTTLRLLYREAKRFHLRPLKKLNFKFDPFHENAKSVRDLLFYLSSRRIRISNENCVIRTDVVNDRSEPTVSVDLNNGLNVLFKCNHLTTLDLARELNGILDKYDVKEEEKLPLYKRKLKSQKRR